jgi:hypothetical protein
MKIEYARRQNVRSRSCQHVHHRARRLPVFGGETIGRDHEFLHCLERHDAPHRPRHRIVVTQTIDEDGIVAAVLARGGEPGHIGADPPP